jgi:putative DNA primase/helicase
MHLQEKQLPAHSPQRGHQHVRDGGNLAVALGYAEVGIPVFPCFEAGPRAKQPRTQRGRHNASTDVDEVQTWWRRWPGALVGIPVGSSLGMWVLDVDGIAGFASLRELLAELGLSKVADLTRVAARTPSGGLHLYFTLGEGERPRNRANDIGPGLDTRGLKEDGTSAGYIIAPGSVLPDGRAYEWADTTTLSDSGECA